jgi:hypothetical protein|tara:strand:- start:913 stop:1497 length:585 start_codon:yes stop_codon:yes gene_type:complete
MTTTPVTLLSKRSGNTSDRPLDTTIQAGELAINFAAAENGLYFKDSVGDIRKVTGVHYGTTAPNSAPAGETGNSVGEIWVEDGANNFLRVWDGTQFIKIGAAFADSAGSATVTIASGAIVANSALVASGAFGSTVASGALGADTASGALIASGLDITVISGAFPSVPASGVFGYKVDPPSGLYISFGGGWVPAA